MLKVYWLGYGGSSYLAEELRPVIESLGMSLTTIHEWENADIKWELGTWLDNLKQADIVIIPTTHEKQPAKSNTRLTQSLAIGKPVVCGPLDAYLQVDKKYPGSFLIAYTKEDWVKHLTDLRDKPELRESLSKMAVIAAQDYSIDAVGKKWAEVLFGETPVSATSCSQIMEPVDLIIVNYNNARYLKLCVESIFKNTPAFNLIISDAGSNEETWAYLESLKGVTLVGNRKTRRNYSEACNAGIEASRAEYFAILNSDLIMSEKWLENILDKFHKILGLSACGVLSNCDFGWLHQEPLRLEKAGIDLKPGMVYEQLEGHIPELYEFMANSNVQHKGVYKEQDWVAGYATVYSRKAVDEIGLFDPMFKNGCEDLDFCKRLRKKGHKIGQALDSFVYHFGGVSRGAYQEENRESYSIEDQANHAYLREKWDRKRVMIYSGPSWERWDFKSLDTTGIGGSETWVIQLSRQLSNIGYKVEVFADCPDSGIKDGDVLWHHYTEYPSWASYNWVDYAILSRSTDPLDFPLRAGKIYTQIHDIFYLSDRNKICLDKIEKHGVLSQWHLDFVADYHKIPKDKLVIMANGIDFNRFDSIQVERQPYRFHWSSSWDRGLDNVLYLWPFIRAEFPTAELHVYYGCITWKASCAQKNDQQGLKKIAELEEAMKTPGVFNHGRKNQKELAEEIKKASILLYASAFSETFYITGIEAQYSGVPVICNKYAGVITTFTHPELGSTALMLGNGDPNWPYSKEGRESFLRETFALLKNKDEWEMWSRRGRQNAERYSWLNCALHWKDLFEKGSE